MIINLKNQAGERVKAAGLDPVQYDQAVVVAVFFTGGKSFG